jgi:hypothetical protein
MENDVRRRWLGILKHSNEKMNVMRYGRPPPHFQSPMLTSRE